MSNHVESLTWLTDLHLEFCSHRTRDRFYHSINQAPGEIVIITGDLSAGPHRLAQYTELAEQIRKEWRVVKRNVSSLFLCKTCRGEGCLSFGSVAC